MNCQKTKEPTPSGKLAIKSFNVTELTASQRRELFMEYMNRSSFAAFIKNEKNKQTYYIFCYKT